MMALVEQDPPRRILAGARGIDHHQRMVGDDQVGVAARPLGALDEAAAVMRAAGIDALAAAVGQRGRSGAAEQARQPAGQVAADHVAVPGVSRPAPDQLRQNGGAAGERALQRVLEVEQAQIILAALADDDLPLPLVGVGEQFVPLAVELALQRLGEGRDPDRPARRLGPQRGRGEIGEGLADPGPGLGQQHVGRILGALGREHLGDRLGHRLLALARLDPPGQRIELGPRRGGVDQHGQRRRLRRRFVPRLQAREQHPLAALGPFEPGADERRPAPAEPVQGRVRRPRPFALVPARIGEHGEQPLGDPPQRRRGLGLARRRLEPERSAQARPRSAPRTAPDERRRTVRAGRAR